MTKKETQPLPTPNDLSPGPTDVSLPVVDPPPSPGESADSARRQSPDQTAPNVASTLSDPRAARQRAPSYLMIALVAGFIAAVICWWQWRSLESAQSTHQALSAALDQMRLDAERIAALREAPQQAADRKKPNEELLGQIERSLRSGNVPPELWQDSIPQPTQRVAQSPYQRYSTRLYFEAITLEQVLRFAHDLMNADPSLAVSSLHLSTPARAKPSTWNIDLTVDYLVYAPSKGNGRL